MSDAYRDLSRLDSQFEVLRQDVKILEANMAVLTDYRKELVESKLRDRLLTMEERYAGLKEDLADARQAISVESARIQNQVVDMVQAVKVTQQEEAQKTRRWTSYAITIACAFLGSAATVATLLLHVH